MSEHRLCGDCGNFYPTGRDGACWAIDPPRRMHPAAVECDRFVDQREQRITVGSVINGRVVPSPAAVREWSVQRTGDDPI